MTSAAVAERIEAPQSASAPRDPFECDPEYIRSLMRGLSDRREGRIVPWSQVKKEFGL